MKRTIAMLTLAAAASFIAPSAQADHVSWAGFTCGFASVTDPTAEPGTQTGEVDGGPILTAALPTIDDSTTPPTVTLPGAGDNPTGGQIECSLQVNSPFHSTSAYASAECTADDPAEDANDATQAQTGCTASAVIYLPPTQISYSANTGDIVYLCTELTVIDGNGNKHVLYYDDLDAGGTGDFITDPTLAHCGEATTVDPEEPEGDPTAPIEDVLCLATGNGDIPPVLDCPEYDTPENWHGVQDEIDEIICPIPGVPDGDIPGVWDCPPYQEA